MIGRKEEMKIEQFTLICYIRSSYKYITLQDTKNNYEEIYSFDCPNFYD